MATDWVTVRVSAQQKARIDGVRGRVPFARWVADALDAQLDVEAPSGPAAATRDLNVVSAQANKALSSAAELRGLANIAASSPRPFSPDAERQGSTHHCPHCEWRGVDGEKCPEHLRAKRDR